MHKTTKVVLGGDLLHKIGKVEVGRHNEVRGLETHSAELDKPRLISLNRGPDHLEVTRGRLR